MKNKIDKKQLKEFGLIIGIGFPLILGFLLPFLMGHNFNIWTIFIGIPSILIGISKPSLLNYPYLIWMKMGLILGWINSRLILGLIFIVVLQPIAFFMKLFGHDPLRIKKTSKDSYKISRKDHIIDLTKIF